MTDLVLDLSSWLLAGNALVVHAKAYLMWSPDEPTWPMVRWSALAAVLTGAVGVLGVVGALTAPGDFPRTVVVLSLTMVTVMAAQAGFRAVSGAQRLRERSRG